MKVRLFGFLAIVFCAIAPLRASATLYTYTATLTGAQEVPATGSSATGIGTVVLDTVANTITVNESWSGLSAPASASHIHTGGIGLTGPVTFPFTGVPAATSGSIPQQVFSITTAQIAALQSSGMYMNVHDANFGGGEIRGQLVPEPASLSLLGLGAIGLLSRRHRRARVG